MRCRNTEPCNNHNDFIVSKQVLLAAGCRETVPFNTFFYNCIVPLGFPPWEIRVAFFGERQLQQSRASQPTVHAGRFSVSIINRTLDMDYRVFNVRM